MDNYVWNGEKIHTVNKQKSKQKENEKQVETRQTDNWRLSEEDRLLAMAYLLW